MTVSQDKNNLVITIPMAAKPSISSTGKTKVVASSGGFQPTTVTVDGKQVKINLTATIPA